MLSRPANVTSVAVRTGWLTPGIRAMAIAAFWYSVMGLLVKLSGRRLPSMQIAALRVLVTLVLSLMAVWRADLPSVFGVQRRLLALRGALGALGLLCYYFSLVHLPLGEASLIQYTNPIFATVLAALWLGERVASWERWCVAGALVGVALVTRPTAFFGDAAPPIAPLHVLVALVGAVASGAAYATVRKLGPREHPAVVILWVPLVALPLALPVAVVQWVTPTPLEWALVLGVGVATQVAQVYMTRGLQAETAVRATTTGYLQVVFAAAWGALLLGEAPTTWTLAGGGVIIGSAVALAIGHGRRAPGQSVGAPGT